MQAHSNSVWSRRPLSTALIAAGLGFAYAPLRAATITVTTTADDLIPNDGSVSLREAITAINAGNNLGDPDIIAQNPGAFGTNDTVQFNIPGCPCTITLGSQITVTQSVQINGPGAATVTISGGGTTRMLLLQPSASGKTFGISALTFANASSSGGGGAIRTTANGTTNITIADSAFTTNHGGGGGGALYLQSLGAGGSLLIQRSTFTGNIATADGGALYLSSSQPGTITIQDSTLSGNTCGDDGGAIYQGTGTLVIQRTTISGNSCPNYGGAISRSNPGGIVTIQNSTITGNMVTVGGGAHGGGGLFLVGQTSTIDNTTIANNTTAGVGGNIELEGTGTLTLRSTIVSGGTDSSGARDIFVQGGVTTFNVSNSLVQNVGNSGITAAGANLIGVSPGLSPLANNGGLTFTMALSSGSPAIDAGSNPDALATDQRGAGFARVVGAAADIGAYELQAPSGPPAPIPALDDRALLALLALTGLGGALALRRRKITH